jgi:hypothetical protein
MGWNSWREGEEKLSNIGAIDIYFMYDLLLSNSTKYCIDIV